MKKLIYSAAALAMAFFAASCQQENLEPVAQESTVTFSVELPGVQTKAIGDGFNVDQLVYEVWKTEAAGETVLNGTDDEGKANATRLYQETAVMTKVGDEQKTVISLNLVHDQNYTILFWAQNSKAIGKEGAETPAYVTSDLTAVTYAKEVTDGSYLSNNENMAAFYGVAFLEKEEVEVPSTRRVELKRPFAQLNIGTKNTAEEYEIAMTQSKVKISNVPTVFDVAQNTPASPAVSDYESFEFSYAALPTNPETLRVNDIPYHYVAMNYIFAGSRNVTVEYNIDATLTAKDSGATTEATVNNTVIEVPLKENYRTNIIGNLITSTTQYEVVIDASWDDVDADNWDGNVEEVWDERYIQEPKMVNGVYEISLASELAWLAAKVNGMPYVDPETNSVKYEAPVKFAGVTFKLVEDIDLVGEDNDQAGYEDYELTWIPIGATGEFQGIFDGQNHTISNLVVKTEGTTPAGLFGKVKSATVKNVTVVNADVQGHGSAAVVVAHAVSGKIENCHVEGATVVSTPINKDDGNNVGGIVGYLDGDSVGYVKNSSVNNATITAYRKVGGIVGSANQKAEVTGNTVSNTTITSDQIPAYKTEEDGNAGPVVGYKHSAATVGEGQEGENVTVIRRVDSTKELEHAVADAQSGDTIYIGGEVTMPYFTDKALNFEGITKSAIVKQSPAAHNDAFYAGAELNFKNLTLVGTEYKNDTQGYQKADRETYEDCNFENYIMFAGKETTVDNCVFTGKYNSYFWTATANNITFNECVFNGVERIVKVCTVGNPGERTVTFNDCTFTATEQKKAAIEIDGTKGSSYKVYINRCNETGFAPGEFTGETMFNIEGMENVEVYVDGELWKLRNPHYEVIEEIVDGNTIKTYQVYTAEGLAKFSYMQNNVERDINLEIMNDIELPQYEIAVNDAEQTYYFTETPITVTDGVPSGSNWVAIGDYNLGGENNRWCYSKIDGNGKTVRGLRMTSTSPLTAFVAYIDLTTGSISNLNLVDAVVHSTKAYTAGLVAWMGDGVAVKNCHLTNVHVNGDDNTGGVVGYCITRHWNDFGTSLIEKCSIDNSSTVNGDTNVGGIVGRNYGSIVKNSSNEATVTGNTYVGGIVGLSLHNGTGRDSGLPLPSYVIACKNIGKIAGANNVGGIIGESQAGSQKSSMVACYTAAIVAEYSNLLIGNCHKTTDNYGSWGLKISDDQKPLVDGTYTSCYAFTSATEAEVNAMNAAIDQYNTGRAADDPTFCPYKWTLTEGNLPVLQ